MFSKLVEQKQSLCTGNSGVEGVQGWHLAARKSWAVTNPTEATDLYVALGKSLHSSAFI